MIEGQVQFTNCILNNNMAHSGGGGVAISHGNSSQITNCVFFDNGSVYYSDEFNTFWVEGNISIMNSIIDYTIDIITNNNRFYGRYASYLI
jgi:parallel beta-helix repeat protein